jgi:hypothetical protein
MNRTAKLLLVGLRLALIAGITLATAPSGTPIHAAPQAASHTRPMVTSSFARLPLSFEPNLGQTDARVKFLSRGHGYTLFLTPTEALLSMREPAKDSSLRSGSGKMHLSRPGEAQMLRGAR